MATKEDDPSAQVIEPLEEDDIQWLQTYAAAVVAEYESVFRTSSVRFRQASQLLTNFQGAVDAVVANGRQCFSRAEELHNEICIAGALVTDATVEFTDLAYEPPLHGCAKRIDFRGNSSERSVYVDVKTIKPAARDRWDQYERALREGWMAWNAEIQLSKDWLGGELWHNWFTARARVLEYTLELEGKVAELDDQDPRTVFVLALCGGGFHWSEDNLEDFVAFYRSGHHFPGDSLGPAELKYVADHGITIQRTIDRFACMFRAQGRVQPHRLNWNVVPPPRSSFL